MQNSVRALLSGVIDYAGMFPPARLPLNTAFDQFVDYRQSSECWLLGKFICPVNHLAELAELIDDEKALSLSVLGRGGSDAAAFVANLEGDLAACDSFRRAGVEAFEVRLPADIVTATAARRLAFFEQCARMLAGRNMNVSFEAGFVDEWRRSLPALLARMHQADPQRFGFKLRCGGLEPAAFPTADQVAFVLRACQDAGVRLKFTAGLHHPVRHFDAVVGAKMHGFINVFAAGVLMRACDLEQEVTAILDDEDAANFRCNNSRISWREHSATSDQVQQARVEFVTSFGSCSFEEPVVDLRNLGWLG